MIVDGIISSISDANVIVTTDLGDTITIPRFFGETPKNGTAVQVDFSTGSPKIYSTPVIALIENVNQYLNFYAIEAENGVPSTSDAVGTSAMPSAKKTSDYGPFIPYSFVDTPVGAQTLVAGNGNIVFGGPTACGMATGCDNKVVVRHTGEMEMVSGHFIALQGRTVIVSNFQANLGIEIDIINVDSGSGAGKFDGIKTAIAKSILGTEGETDPATGETTVTAKDPMTYEEAFDEAVGDDHDNGAFLRMFGLHIAEILVTVQWERVRFRGDEKTFQEVFSGIASFQNYIGYCTGCYNSGKIKEMEFFVSAGDSNSEGASVVVPQCEEQVADTIYELNAEINGEQYTVDAMNIVLGGGTRIEYVAQKRVYSFSHGVIAKKSFTSADQQGVFSNKLHVDVDKISFSNLSFDEGVPDFCGNSTGLPTIYWNGNFALSISGTASITSVQKLVLASSVETLIAGGTRGIKIDSSGSTAVTF